MEKLIEKQPLPRGLVNTSVNCYLNSLVQCLFFTKDFRQNLLIQNKPKMPENVGSIFEEIIFVFNDLIDKEKKNDPADLKYLKLSLNLKNDQEDPAEMLHMIIEKLLNELKLKENKLEEVNLFLYFHKLCLN